VPDNIDPNDESFQHEEGEDISLPLEPLEFEDSNLLTGVPRQYIYNERNGLELIGRNSNVKLANFRPTIRKIVTVYDGEEVYKEYILRCSKPDYFIDITLTREDLKSDRNFREKLSTHLDLDQFLVTVGSWSHLMTAMNEMLQEEQDKYPVVRENSYASMGWVNYDPMIYLLPSCKGVDGNGVRPDIVMNDSERDKLPENWKNYGKNFIPPDEYEHELIAKAFNQLLNLDAAMVLMATQMLAGPLSSFGAREMPPLMHIVGRTGTLKSARALVAMSLFGTFSESTKTETWFSTQNSLMRAVHDAKDVTLLVDDYKKSRLSADPVMFIQNYADGSTRGRLGVDQTRRRALLPRGLVLSTGEDSWESQESASARTVMFDSKLSAESITETYLQQLSELQQFAKHGILASFGADWVRWLASTSPAYLEGRIHALRELTEADTAHRRLTGTLGTLYAVSQIVCEFLADKYPELLPVYQQRWSEAWDVLTLEAREQSLEAATTSPYISVISEITETVASGLAHFIHRSKAVSRTLGKTLSAPIGYYDEANLYLTKSVTYEWLSRRAVDTHRDAVPWLSFVREARKVHGPLLNSVGVDSRLGVWGIRDTTMRCLVLPRYALGLEDVETPEDTSEAPLEFV
jgi:hypothetical protein